MLDPILLVALCVAIVAFFLVIFALIIAGPMGYRRMKEGTEAVTPIAAPSAPAQALGHEHSPH